MVGRKLLSSVEAIWLSVIFYTGVNMFKFHNGSKFLKALCSVALFVFLSLRGNLSVIVFGLLALQMYKRTNFNSPFRPSLFFLKKRLRFQIEEQALTDFNVC